MHLFRFFTLSLFILSASASAERWDAQEPASYERFQEAFQLWNRMTESDEPISFERADRIRSLLSPILQSPTETYAIGRFIYLNPLQAMVTREQIGRALEHFTRHRSSYFILYERSGMGMILQSWGVLDANLQVVGPQFEVDVPERLLSVDRLFGNQQSQSAEVNVLTNECPGRGAAFAEGLCDPGVLTPVSIVSDEWGTAALANRWMLTPSDLVSLARLCGKWVREGRPELAHQLMTKVFGCPERVLAGVSAQE